MNQTVHGQSDHGDCADLWRFGALAWATVALAAILIGGLYFEGLRFLVSRWDSQGEFSHGYFIPLVSLFLVWQNKNLLTRQRFDGSWAGIAILLFGLFFYFVGTFGTIFMVVHYSLIVVLCGLTLAFAGWRPMRHLWVALLFLIFMVPFPNFLLNQLSLALQLVSSEIGVAFIRLFGISVFLEGNVIDLGPYQLQVVDACSGLRYLFPLASFGFLIAYFFKAPLWQRVVIFLSTIPITVLMNSFRIGVIGLLVDNFGAGMAEGFLHDFEGWIVFMACTGILLGEVWLFARFGGQRRAFSDAFNLNLPDPLPAECRRRSRPVPKPFIVALLVLVLATIGAPLLGERSVQQPERIEFSVFPDRIGEWDGTSSTLEAGVLEGLHLDDYYIGDFITLGSQPVNFYVAYYGSQQVGEAAHSPRSCLPGGGWKIESLQTITLDEVPVGGEPLRVNRMLIQKGQDRQMVYYWFQQRDRLLTSEYAVKWFLFWDALTRNRTDGALIRLTTPIPAAADWETGDQRLREFARTLYPELTRFLPDS